MLGARSCPEARERKHRSFEEIAVLSRTHRQAELVETCLRKRGSPTLWPKREFSCG